MTDDLPDDTPEPTPEAILGAPLAEPLRRALGERYLQYALSTIMHRALPDARDCSIRLESGGRLRFACEGDPRWSGFGRFRWEGDRLELQVETLLRGPARSDEVAPSWSGTVTGPGNQITWRLESGERYVWVRKPR